MTEKIETRQMDPWTIRDHPENPRKRLRKGSKKYQAIERSIDRFGLVEPLVWNKRSTEQGWDEDEDGILVGGHQRLQIIREKGWKKVTVSVVDVNADEELALLVTLNKVEGDWNSDTLADILAKIKTSKVPVNITGFDGAELDRLLDKAKEEEPEWVYTPELLEEHNYLVLYFDNEVDWQSAKDVFSVGPVHAKDSRPGYERKGIGRLVPGAEVVKRLLAAEGRS